jgi:hypothetical protein
VDLAVLASSVLLVVIDELEVHLCLVGLVKSWLILDKGRFTSTKRPRVSGCPSGLGIFKKASTSPMAGMYSGTKAFSLVSSSCRMGVYLGYVSVTFGWI